MTQMSLQDARCEMQTQRMVVIIYVLPTASIKDEAENFSFGGSYGPEVS